MNPVESGSVKQFAILHDHPDRIGVPDVEERVSVEDYEIRDLPDLDASEIAIEPDRLGALNRGDLDTFQHFLQQGISPDALNEVRLFVPDVVRENTRLKRLFFFFFS